jgi:hypothetical protein
MLQVALRPMCHMIAIPQLVAFRKALHRSAIYCSSGISYARRAYLAQPTEKGRLRAILCNGGSQLALGCQLRGSVVRIPKVVE